MPRSGSTYVFQSLRHYILKKSSYKSMSDTVHWDEPFHHIDANLDQETRAKNIDNILSKDHWVVKHLIDQRLPQSEILLSKLFKASDKVVVLKRNYIDQILSLATAQKLQNFHHNSITIEFTELEIKTACLEVAENRFILERCFADQIINYENLQYPRKVISEVLEIDIDAIKPFDVANKKNYTNITNRDKCIDWISDHYEPFGFNYT